MKVLIVTYKREPSYKGPALIRDNSKDNIGFARAVNDLIQRTDEDVILLSHDASPVGDALRTMQETAYSDDRIGIVQAKMMRPDGTIDTTGHQIIRKYRLGGALAITGRGEGEVDRGQYDSLTELPSVDFAAVFIKRKVIEDVGLLDPKLFLGVDDIDYCIRAHKRGWRTVMEPRAVVIHERSLASRSWSSRSQLDLYYLYAKNAWWKSLATAYVWNMLGILAAAKNRDARFAKMKLRGLVPF